jgi:thiol-disulfide isomerase/thioredoxin
LNFISEQRPIADNLRKSIEAAGEDATQKAKFEEELAKIDESVFIYQDELIQQHPKSLTAATIRSNKGTTLPEFIGTDEEIQIKRWHFSKVHYFDNIDLADPRMARTPFLFQRVNHFISKLTAQHPDSISQSIDVVLKQMETAEDTYKYYLVHFLNEYAKSKVIGFDAVYVHLALNYYKEGKAPWTDEDQLEKIIENGKKLKPLLLGKTAPNIKMQTKEGKELELHSFQAKYTVLFFWDPDCGHCKKATPKLLEFHEKFNSQGVEIFGICTKLVEKDDDGKWTTEGMKECWDYTEEKGTNIWLNTVDSYHRSRYKTVYDIRTTPQIYVLDKDKKILLKKVGAEQLSEVMEQILKEQK